MTKVLFPHPDSPTKATVSHGLIVILNPFNTKSSFLVGYLNHTFLNSICPFIFSAYKSDLSFSISTAFIFDGLSIILNIFSAAALAFVTSGPNEADVPAYEAPKNIANIAIKIFSDETPYVPVTGS